MRKINKFFTILALVLILTSIGLSVVRAERSVGPKAYVFYFEGRIINEGLASAVLSALSRAESDNALLVLILDTPGGELAATEKIIRAFLNSRVPIIGFVYPKGAAAWSAGTLILISCHIAAMAPGTMIGAAQPITYGAEGFQPLNYSKIINPIVEMAETVSRERGRNQTAARLFVQRNLTLNDEEALRSNVIDLVAENVGDLLMKIDGMEVKVAGEVVKINTKGFTIEKYEWSISDILSNALADPLLANLLFMLGFYILLLSLITGHYPIVAVGLLLLILGLMGLGFSINTISTLLIIVGVVLVVIEMITPGFGIIGTTGIIMLALGFLLLPIYLPQTWFIGPEFFFRFIVAGILIIVAGSAFFAFALYKVIKAKKARPVIWSIIGAKGKALDDLGPGKEGFVMVEGEYWMAFSDEEIKAGEEIVVVGKVGPKLKVKKVSRK